MSAVGGCHTQPHFFRAAPPARLGQLARWWRPGSRVNGAVELVVANLRDREASWIACQPPHPGLGVLSGSPLDLGFGHDSGFQGHCGLPHWRGGHSCLRWSRA